MSYRRATQRRHRAGFTLIELLIIVAIVGILSALAIFAYRQWLAQARTGETKDLLQTLMLGEHSYYATTEGYLDCSTSWIDYYPTAPTDTKHPFHKPTHAEYRCYKLLAPDTKAPTYASFSVRAGVPGDTVPTPPLSDASTYNNWTADPTKPWFVVLATVNQDNDGVLGYWMSSSFEPNNVHSENPEE